MQAQDNIIDEVIWIVGDDAILKSDVENMRLDLQIKGERVQGDPYCTISEQMAIQKLYVHQAKLDSITTSESDVSRRLDAQINHYLANAPSQEKIEEWFGKPMFQIREEMRENIRESMIVQEMQRKLIGDVRLTPADIRRFYTSIPQDSLPFIPTTVEVEIITVEPRISIEETDRIKGLLRDYTERVNNGEVEFATLARMWSEDKESAKRGGELGFKGKAELVPEFAAVAFSMNDQKKVSKIVESEYGFHIIQLIEKRGDRINVRHILMRPKVSETELVIATQQLDSVGRDIKEGKFSFEEAATYLSHDKDTRNNKGLMVNNDMYSQNTGTSKFELQELPSEMGKIVYGMKVGDISEPFTMINSKQKEVAAIVKLISRVEGHKANISDDYIALKSMAEDRKREEILDKWIKDKISSTYIRINDNWKNCDFQLSGWIKE